MKQNQIVRIRNRDHNGYKIGKPLAKVRLLELLSSKVNNTKIYTSVIVSMLDETWLVEDISTREKKEVSFTTSHTFKNIDFIQK